MDATDPEPKADNSNGIRLDQRRKHYAPRKGQHPGSANSPQQNRKVSQGGQVTKSEGAMDASTQNPGPSPQPSQPSQSSQSSQSTKVKPQPTKVKQDATSKSTPKMSTKATPKTNGNAAPKTSNKTTPKTNSNAAPKASGKAAAKEMSHDIKALEREHANLKQVVEDTKASINVLKGQATEASQTLEKHQSEIEQYVKREQELARKEQELAVKEQDLTQKEQEQLQQAERLVLADVRVDMKIRDLNIIDARLALVGDRDIIAYLDKVIDEYYRCLEEQVFRTEEEAKKGQLAIDECLRLLAENEELAKKVEEETK
ncbi:hypothetical protein GGR52DRAFT_56982 [Hypoxylon sp. FL1284]|nr:hypothetical protein GGR52DRAFT_56982 [Hypoxylon sp. FL1284]